MEPAPDHEHEKIERLRRAMYSRDLSDKIKDRPRHSLETPRPIVGEDWRRPEEKLSPTLVAPRTITLARKALRWALVAAIVFFLSALAFFAYYFTFGGGSSPASPGNIGIEISGPVQIAGGEPTQLQVAVTNRNQVALLLADLVITYPSGTRSPVDLSTDLSTQRIPLGTIEPGGRRQGTVSAVFAGGGSSSAEVQVDLEYRLEGSSAIFVASSNYLASFSASALSVSVGGNAETVSGQSVELRVTVASNAAAPVRDVLLTAAFPFGFTFSSATPQPARDAVWELGDIAPGERREIVIRGVLRGDEGDQRQFRFSTGTRASRDEPTLTTSLADSSFAMRITESFLGLSLSVGGRSGRDIVVTPGQTVTVAINWLNNIGTQITDAVIVARLSGMQIDGATVNVSDGFYRSGDGSVLWDKTTTRGTFANILSGMKGAVTFSFEVPDSETLSLIRDPSLTISVNASGKRLAESGVPENLQATVSQRIAVASDLTVTAHGLYYNNPFGSVGPLPPKAETETTYAVVFTITNTTNAIKNGKLTATLPPYVRWVGIYSPASESVSFNQNTGTVTWQVGDVEAGVGIGESSPRQAAIAIGFTPSTSQIGEEPILLQNMTFTGTDSTGELISETIQNVTTNLQGDSGFNSTQATVVR